MENIAYTMILFLGIFIHSVAADDKCIVKYIEVQRDFDPDLFEGKWFVISVTKLWGKSFIYSRGGKSERKMNSETTNSRRNDKNWSPLIMKSDNGLNTNQEESNFKHQIKMGIGSLRPNTGPKFPPVFQRSTDVNDMNTQFPSGRPMSTGSHEQISSVKKWGQRMRKRQFSGRNWTTPDGELSMWSSNRTRASSRDTFVWRDFGHRRRGRGQKIQNGTVPPWVPQNIQLVYKVREDKNLDIYIVNEVMTRCMLTRGIGTTENLDIPAKLLTTFPIRMFSPCQPYWILKTDYSGYAVVYFCLNVLPDGSCEEDKIGLWTMNRKMTGHNSEELQKVQSVSSNVCVDHNKMRQIVQDNSCHIQKEITESKEKSLSIKCNDYEKVNVGYVEGVNQSHRQGHNPGNSLTFSTEVQIIVLLLVAFLY